QLILFLPFIWAHPVIPGRTSCLLACSSVYKSKYSTNNGLGPTILISPFKTLINCGSSSRLVFRKTLPNFVIRLLLGNKQPNLSLLFFIVLNLYMWNFSPCKPGLCCLKITGNPIFNNIVKAIMRIGIENIVSKINENVTSNIRFISLSPLYFLDIYLGMISFNSVYLLNLLDLE